MESNAAIQFASSSSSSVTIETSRVRKTLAELHIGPCDLVGFYIPENLRHDPYCKPFCCIQDCWRNYTSANSWRKHVEDFSTKGSGHMALHELISKSQCHHCGLRTYVAFTFMEHLKEAHLKIFKSHMKKILALFGITPGKYC
jgi:hypothetical protein